MEALINMTYIIITALIIVNIFRAIFSGKENQLSLKLGLAFWLVIGVISILGVMCNIAFHGMNSLTIYYIVLILVSVVLLIVETVVLGERRLQYIEIETEESLKDK